MIFLANIALALACLIWTLIVRWTYFEKPRHSGDAKLGQLVSTLFATIIFVIGLTVMFLIIWLSARRFTIARDFSGLSLSLATGIHLLFVLLLVPSSLIDRSDLPWMLRPFPRLFGLLLSSLTLGFGAVVLHADVDSIAIRVSMEIASHGVPLEAIVLALLGGELLLRSRGRAQDQWKKSRDLEAQITSENLRRVQVLDLDSDLSELIGYLGRFQDHQVRETARTRLADAGDWRARVPDLLRSRAGFALIPWLAAESQERVLAFEESLVRLVELMTSEVHERVTTNHHLMAWGLDDLRIGDLLMILRSYPDRNRELRCAVEKLRAVIESPDSVVDSKVIFPDRQRIDDWLASVRAAS